MATTGDNMVRDPSPFNKWIIRVRNHFGIKSCGMAGRSVCGLQRHCMYVLVLKLYWSERSSPE